MTLGIYVAMGLLGFLQTLMLWMLNRIFTKLDNLFDDAAKTKDRVSRIEERMKYLRIDGRQTHASQNRAYES